jgi:hypothetical protein
MFFFRGIMPEKAFASPRRKRASQEHTNKLSHKQRRRRIKKKCVTRVILKLKSEKDNTPRAQFNPLPRPSFSDNVRVFFFFDDVFFRRAFSRGDDDEQK